jgi:glycosyltransferase involved in cell wall biosynthesis
MIFESEWAGHRLQYVRAILDALAPLAVSTVFVCGRGTRETQEFATHLEPIRDRFEVDESGIRTRGKTPQAAAMRRFLDFRKALARHRPDHVYLPYADGLMQVAGVSRALGLSLSRPGMEMEGLLMRGRFAYEPGPTSVRTRATIKALELSPFDIVHHLDPVVFEYLLKRCPGLAGRLRLLPEAVERIDVIDKSVARARLGIPTGGRYIGCLGAMSAAKGVNLLIKAFLRSALATDIRLLLIGEVDAELQGLLKGEYLGDMESGQIMHIDRYVSQEDFHLGFNALDVICTPYPRQIGSSGIVVRAAAVGRPVLGSEFGWVGRVIRDFELGETCDVDNGPAFAAKVVRALKIAENYRPGPKAQHFKAFHSIGNFEAHWTRRLRERLNIGEPRQLVRWEWPSRC